MTRFSTILTLASGRRAKWLALGFWLLLVAALFPSVSRFESVQQNDSASYLPQDAQSTQAIALARSFEAEEQPPAVVVYRRESGLTPDDLRRAEEDQRAILAAGIEGVVPAPVPLQPSADGKALIFLVPIAPGGEIELLLTAVDAIRERVSEGAGGGLEVAVTGPAGFAADAIEVFGAIDVQLLGATAALVAVLLLLTYRSPFLWLLPLVAVGFAEITTRGLGYWLARSGVTINGQTAGLLTVLVFGAGTDYALLLIARYREELRRHEDKHAAMRQALRRAGPALVASGATVAAALLCLLAAELNSNRGLGPIAALGIGVALLSMLTLLPALLLLAGRRVFWPYVPRFGSPAKEESPLFGAVGRAIARRPRAIWVGTALLLGLFALGATRTSFDLYSDDGFRASVQSVEGAKLLEGSFPPGAGAATTVFVRPASAVATAAEAARGVEGVAEVLPTETAPTGDLARFGVILANDPYSAGAFDTVERLRDRVGEIGDGTLVGGPSAEEADVRTASIRDARVIVPLILVAVLVILGLLLRSIVAPLLLMATVILSFVAAFGVSILVFEFGFGFPGIDPSLPLLAFIFLVALGVDYNIFLMDRAREEAAAVGTRRGMLRALAVTGGVITAAGIVLAGTFAVLGVLPLVPLTQIGFIVAFGVLLDAIVVRSVLVPALVLDVGPRVWWPSALSRRGEERLAADAPLAETAAAD